MHISNENLNKILIDSGLIAQEQFDEAKQDTFKTDVTVAGALISKGLITERILAETLSDFFQVQMIDLEKMKIPMDVLHSLPEQFSKTRRAVVFEINEKDKIVKVAMEDPADLETVDLISARVGMQVVPHLSTRSDIKSVFKEYKRDIYKEFDNIINESIRSALTSGIPSEDLAKMSEFVPIVKIMDSIMEYAMTSGASDVHIERQEEKVLVRYRIDGILRDITALPKELHEALVARIKILSSLQIDVHFSPQDGRFKFELEDEKMDVRVSVMPTFYGEKVVMRLLKAAATLVSFIDLGLSEEGQKKVKESIKRTFGMILVTGPTGSGKTTTLYTMLHLLNNPGVSIATIEDPIEYDVQRINQTQVNPKSGITFSNGLKSLMRQNPDIIMVGEIRDADTVDISLNAAMTGHLLLSTLHTNDAPTAIPRLIDMGGEPFLIASTLNVVVAQRLVRKICSSCIFSYTPAPEILASIQLQLEIHGQKNPKLPSQFFRGKGCNACGFTGYHGQIGIFEIMEITPNIRKIITSAVSIDKIKETARAEGMTSMFEDGLDKAEKGITTIEEVMRVTME